VVAAYRREKNFNPVEILKNGKRGDTRRPALPRGAARRRVWLQKRRRAAKYSRALIQKILLRKQWKRVIHVRKCVLSVNMMKKFWSHTLFLSNV